MKKIFADMENRSNFAVYFNSQGKRKPAKYIFAGIFYAITYYFIVRILNDIRLLPPCGALMRPLPCEVKYNGKGQPFLFAYNAKIVRFHMADLFNVKTMSSLQIAELTGKTHSNVMRDIRNLLEQVEDKHGFSFELMFKITKLGNGAERKDPYYNLTKKDCLLLASGYDANLRAKIINRWEELETRELSRKELALMVIQAEEDKERLALEVHQKQETIELQQKELAQAAPKVQYVDTVLKSVNTYATNLIAKEMGMSAETLNKRLKEKGIQYRQSGVWVLTSRYQDKGYTKTRTHTYTRSDGSQSTAMLTVWTEQGREFLHSLFKA